MSICSYMYINMYMHTSVQTHSHMYICMCTLLETIHISIRAHISCTHTYFISGGNIAESF